MSALKMAKAIRSLRRAVLTPVTVQTWTRHKGVVHTTSPLTIYLDGGTVALPAHCLSSYTPTIDDVVYVCNVDGDLVVHDKYSL